MIPPPGHPPHGWDWPDDRMKSAERWFLRWLALLLLCLVVGLAGRPATWLGRLSEGASPLAVVCVLGMVGSAALYMVRKEQARRSRLARRASGDVKRVR